MHRSSAVGAVAVSVAAAMMFSPGAMAANDSQKGKSTLDETIKTSGTGFKKLVKGKGENYKVLTDLAKAKSQRAGKRKSLTFFGQLTDPQLADEMSPARLELIDPVGGATSAAWRPQEALGPRVFDSIIRNMNANSRSRVKQGNGDTAKLQYALLTGDIADSQQFNEVGWFRGILEGRTIDPFSGKQITSPDECNAVLGRQITQAEVDKLNEAVAKRQYTGVQDYDDWPGQNLRTNGYWDPDVGGEPNPSAIADYGAFPKYPGLMDRAQQKLKAAGLKVPWFITRGNHDTLVQGNVPANEVIGGLLSVQDIALGCQKPWPNNNMDPTKIDTSDSSKVFEQLLSQLNGVLYGLNSMPLVPPDPDRRYVSKVQFKQYVGKKDKQHGFDYVSEKQDDSSRGNASYYGFNRGKFRIIMLDTNAEGGGSQGNLDDPQYKWLAKQLDRYSSVQIRNGKLKRDGDKDKMIILASHHTLETMVNTTPDEAAGTCDDPQKPGCDSDPRLSTPLHLGTSGKESVLKLLKSYPNVVAYVNGHTHHNRLRAFKGAKAGKFRGGFWQINTASHVDWAQQSRTIEILDNKDNTLSIFGTILNSAAPITPPKPGTSASQMTDSQLASISRSLAANDPQTYDTTDSTPESGGGLGLRKDRNAEMIVKDPRQLWKKQK